MKFIIVATLWFIFCLHAISKIDTTKLMCTDTQINLIKIITP
jgi:hypothetical protein